MRTKVNDREEKNAQLIMKRVHCNSPNKWRKVAHVEHVDDGDTQITAQCEDDDAVWRQLCMRVSNTVDPMGASQAAIEHYVKFCSRFKSHMEYAGYGFIELPIGKVGATAHQLFLYLEYERERSSTRGGKLSANELKKKVAAIRAGVAEYAHAVKLPQCLRAQADYTMWERKHFCKWHRDDTLDCCRPVQEKAWLTGEQIEDFCVSLVSKLLSGDTVTDKELLTALVNRIQSGTNVRCGNLTKHLLWKDVHDGEGCGHYGSIDIVNTKRISPTNRNVKSLLALKGKVQRDVDDDITGLVFKEYITRFSAGRMQTDNFFPKIADETFHWGHTCVRVRWDWRCSNIDHLLPIVITAVACLHWGMINTCGMTHSGCTPPKPVST